jgi:hypothetical protein
MAEALLRHLSKGRGESFSAGSVPQEHVHPWPPAVAGAAPQQRAFEHVASGLSNRVIHTSA